MTAKTAGQLLALTDCYGQNRRPAQAVVARSGLRVLTAVVRCTLMHWRRGRTISGALAPAAAAASKGALPEDAALAFAVEEVLTPMLTPEHAACGFDMVRRTLLLGGEGEEGGAGVGGASKTTVGLPSCEIDHPTSKQEKQQQQRQQHQLQCLCGERGLEPTDALAGTVLALRQQLGSAAVAQPIVLLLGAPGVGKTMASGTLKLAVMADAPG